MRHRQRSVINIVSEPPPPPPDVFLKLCCLANVTFFQEWTPAGGHQCWVEPHCDGGRGDFARGGGTSKCLLLRPWQLRHTSTA